ncbi:hypothetical protein [Streptomyces sp. NPDC053755]|uniref:hypothetical protein n=1 Tax=Streptomyces sp. NPDC053755 TaxID=3155815 RepID=UPI003422A220
MPQPFGFGYERRADGAVLLTHRGRAAGTLRGGRAERFLAEVESGDAQMVMARWTGAYKFGNERVARDHPRNRSGRRAGR